MDTVALIVASIAILSMFIYMTKEFGDDHKIPHAK